MKSAPAVTSIHMTKLQSIKGGIHSSLIWKDEQTEAQNLCPLKSHTLTPAGDRAKSMGDLTSLQACKLVKLCVHVKNALK